MREGLEHAAQICDEIAERHHNLAIARCASDGCDNGSYDAMEAAKECAADIRAALITQPETAP